MTIRTEGVVHHIDTSHACTTEELAFTLGSIVKCPQHCSLHEGCRAWLERREFMDIIDINFYHN